MQDRGFGNRFLALETAILDINARMVKMFKLFERTVESTKFF